MSHERNFMNKVLDFLRRGPRKLFNSYQKKSYDAFYVRVEHQPLLSISNNPSAIVEEFEWLDVAEMQNMEIVKPRPWV